MNSPTESSNSNNPSQTSPVFTNLKEMTQPTSLSEPEKINKLFERIFQITLDPNFSNANNKCIFIGELMDTDTNAINDTLLSKDNLDEV
jgi:hypothetical protein